MQNYNTKVVIAGAGPTGLMAACQLRRFGIECIVVDKKSGPTVESRALGVQARTLEIYEQMGIAGRAVEDGQVLTRANLLVEGKIKGQIPFGDMGKGLSPYPFLLVYEQYKNEKLLYEYLQQNKGDVWWNAELEEITEDNSGVTVKVKKGGGYVSIKAGYLLGADGARSIVRHKLGFEFEGGTYENIFFVADTEVDWQYGYEQLFMCLSQNTFCGLFAMKGHHRFRIIGIMPKGFKDEYSLTLEDIEQEITGRLKIKADFKNTSWFSVYRLHHRHVSSFRMGRIFLAGDAAHIHSPAGGQGMNTGLQDVYNLAWKLAYVIRGYASEKLLDTYNEERLPFAKRLIRTTDRAFAFISSFNPVLSFFRVWIIPLFAGFLMRVKFVRKLVFKGISQTGIEYRAGSISKSGKPGFSKGSPEAGDRAPYVFLYYKKERVSIYDLLHSPSFHLLVFGDEMDFPETDIIKVIYINSDKNADVYKAFGIKTKGVYLIRPDNYIGFRSTNISYSEINSYFTECVHFIKEPFRAGLS